MRRRLAGVFLALTVLATGTAGMSTIIKSESVIEGFAYIVGVPPTPTTTNDCPPATYAACGKIMDGVQGILVTAAASAVIDFTMTTK